MSVFRIYRNPNTYDMLCMTRNREQTGWIPHTEAMKAWRNGSQRIYEVNENLYITMPNGRHWFVLSDSEIQDIRTVWTTDSWIPYGAAIDGIAEHEIPSMDAGIEAALRGDTISPQVERILRPALVWTNPISEVQFRPPPPPPPSPPPAPIHQQTSLPPHIAKLVLETAEANHSLCPITMEPITAKTSSVTSCGHAFDKSAITSWLSTNTTCPECRQPCVI